MLKTLDENHKNNWKYHLPKLMFAYNSTINKTTGYSPFFLMFGRSSRLHADSCNSSESSDDSEIEFVVNRQTRSVPVQLYLTTKVEFQNNIVDIY